MTDPLAGPPEGRSLTVKCPTCRGNGNVYRSELPNITPRWIPVGERLPENYRKVPVTTGDGYWESASIYEGVWRDHECLEFTGVTHWLELPPLPEEK